MQDTFITKIRINKVRHLSNFDISLGSDISKHLILTGKNGSGKTSLLEAMRDYILIYQRNHAPHLNDTERQGTQDTLFFGKGTPGLNDVPGVELMFPENVDNFLDTMFVYIAAERNEFEQPKAIEAFESWGKTIITKNASKGFLKYILSLYVQYLSAKDANASSEEVAKYKAWFDRFTEALQDIYNCPQLSLIPDMRSLEFRINMPNREPFSLNEMSDGYKAILEIMMELLIRFEDSGGIVDYNHSAIVLIDEIETHLHVELQKRALPFLTKMFPCVQFIVSTHSPFVITSLSNALVYDLEKREMLENPAMYSYESIVESFLDSNMYSEEMARQFKRYEELCFKERTAEENEEFLRAKTELELMSPASKELYIAFRALEKKRKEAKRGQAQ